MNAWKSPPDGNKREILLLALFLTAVTLLVFAQLWQYGFVQFDDETYVAGNLHVQSGLSAANLVWAFRSTDAGFWHPLTWLSLMLDYELFGLNAGGYHGTNLILHLMSTLLLFYVFSAMTASVRLSAFLAALFALHPLHVESVAWIAERKDVLSTLFWMGTMAAYVFYVRRPGALRYLLVTLLFVLGLMAKPMLVTLPFCLLLLDFWPLERADFFPEGPGRRTDRKALPVRLAFLTLEKLPLILLALGAALLVWHTESSYGVLASREEFPLKVRISHAFVSYAIYLGKMLWPSRLAVFYPHPGGWPLITVLAALVFLGAVTFFAVRYARRFPYVLTGWLWYLGTMVPLIGFVQLGTQGMADRYTYISLIGIGLILAWGAPDLLKGRRYRAASLSVAAVLVLAVLSVIAWRQTGYWRDAETLFSRAAEVTKNNYLAYNNLGAALAREGRLEDALKQYQKALAVKPLYADAWFNMGQALDAGGRGSEAEGYYREALRIKPSFAEAHNNLGIVLAVQGKKDEAHDHFTAAVRIRPDFAAAKNNLRLLSQERRP